MHSLKIKTKHYCREFSCCCARALWLCFSKLVQLSPLILLLSEPPPQYVLIIKKCDLYNFMWLTRHQFPILFHENFSLKIHIFWVRTPISIWDIDQQLNVKQDSPEKTSCNCLTSGNLTDGVYKFLTSETKLKPYVVR